MLVVFGIAYYVPLANAKVVSAIVEAFKLLQWYARNHTLACVVPALFINFSVTLLIVWLALLGLMAFRFFFIFSRVACVRCRAQKVCPQAQQMGFNRQGETDADRS